MKRWLASAAIVLLSASLAAADGDGPTRKMTAAETAAYESTRKSVREALPATLADYAASFSGFDGPAELPEALSADRMHRMSFAVKYTLTAEASQRQAVAAVMQRTQGTQAQQDKLAALRAKNAELKKARKTRDRDEKERIRAELKALNAEENRLVAEIASANQARATAGGGIPAMQELGKTLPAKELALQLQINQDVRITGQAKPYSLPGFPTAFDQNEGCPDFGSYCITVLLGPFAKGKQVGGSTEYTLRNSPSGVPTKPRGLALVVSGPKDKPEAVRNLLQKTNLGKLKALLP
ncbi:MAG: hypothetical protein ACYC7J_15685 [Syntrophales bacterium]